MKRLAHASCRGHKVLVGFSTNKINCTLAMQLENIYFKELLSSKAGEESMLLHLPLRAICLLQWTQFLSGSSGLLIA
jgi:hypothetical protein